MAVPFRLVLGSMLRRVRNRQLLESGVCPVTDRFRQSLDRPACDSIPVQSAKEMKSNRISLKRLEIKFAQTSQKIGPFLAQTAAHQFFQGPCRDATVGSGAVVGAPLGASWALHDLEARWKVVPCISYSGDASAVAPLSPNIIKRIGLWMKLFSLRSSEASYIGQTRRISVSHASFCNSRLNTHTRTKWLARLSTLV